MAAILMAVVAMVLSGGVGTAMAGPAASAPASAPSAKRDFKEYPTTLWKLHTDLDEAMVMEAQVRLNALAEEFSARTRGFGGTGIRSRLGFWLYSRAEDYHAGGGPPGSAGLYKGDVLMAMASKDRGKGLWHTVQHEAFHQFAHKTISAKLPIWINEGMADYFGEGLWTGDRMVTGVIPPARLKRIRALIKEGTLLDFEKMTQMEHKEWNQDLQLRNYDQAWSMVHFLLHAYDGANAQKFGQYAMDVSRGQSPKSAFAKHLGRDMKGFQKLYTDWWTSLDDNPTAELYNQAAVETLTSFLARGKFMRLTFADWDGFKAAAAGGKLAVDIRRFPGLYLPESLLEDALKACEKLVAQDAKFELGAVGAGARVKLTTADGTLYVGSYELTPKDVKSVSVTVTKPRPVTTKPAGK